MRSIIIQFVIVFSITKGFCQLRAPYDPCLPCSGTNISYGTTSYFSQPNQVASDFGPRYVVTSNRNAPYDWHGGIDFNTSQGAGEGQRWWMIVSPQAGIIADFDRLTHGVAEYKYGLVNITDDEGNGSHTLLFGHVFDKEKVEKVILQKTDSSQSNKNTPQQTTTPGVQDNNFFPIASSNISDHTLEIPTDEFNVYKYLLSFYDKNTKTLLKKVDLVQDNPYHTKGLERRKEPFKNLTYFLSAPKAKNKYDVKQFLPQEFFNEIPEDFPIERAIASIYLSVTGTKYATVTYELDWLPDAYSDQGEWDGPGYGVHYVVVYDSLGNKIFNRQFDGTSHLPSVSMDGKYLFTMACLSPEWDKNIRYRFTVFNIKTGKTAYTELIENCQKNGGGGDIYPEFRFANGYYALIKNENVKGFSYENNKLFKYLNENKFTMFDISEEQLLLKYPNGREVIVKKDSLYQQIKID